MTPKQLKYFIEIARQLSFTKASAILHVTQPALSRQMQDLEESLGVKLFTRSDSGISLTPAGRHLSERAPALIEAARQVRQDVAALADVPAGSLRFGITPSLCDLVTAPSVKAYTQQYPRVRLSVTEASSTELTELISSGALDFAIVASTESTSRFSISPILREPMCLAARRGTWVSTEPVDPAELVGLDIVASRQPNALRRILDAAMSEAGSKATITLEANSVKILTQATADGIGYCVLPYSALARMIAEGSLDARVVRSLSVNWSLLHVRNVAPTPSVIALVNIIVDVARTALDEGRWKGLDILPVNASLGHGKN